MMSLWDALRMNMMISYQELVRTFPNTIYASANDVILPNLALGTGVLIAAWVYIRYLKR
ncbi:Uncharacterised protein [Klebsiella pneumoniae]|nr:Uncharacterised protein [Klebsiella pneumoniae]SXQ17791.1 Uncharacterised protein [Klebsiella pneumoniae]